MAVLGAVQKQELQHITEEMYKRNAELAIKNKTLSLLHQLYEITATSLEIEELSDQLTEAIAHILHLPFVGILTRSKNPRHLVPRGAASAVQKRKQILQQANAQVLFARKHPLITTLKEKRHTRTSDFPVLVDSFLLETSIQHIEETMPIKTSLLFPLTAGSRQLGILILSLDRRYVDLSKFEKDAIVNVVNVVSVALDKVSIYDDLRTANDKLRELDELKTEFLSIASHQLRTPLSIIKGYIELLQEGAYGAMPAESQEILRNIETSNEHLVKLVDEFLNISRIEQGRTKYYFEDLDLTAVVDSITSELKEKANPQGIVLTTHTAPQTPHPLGDAEKIRHCLYNFIDNAIKYSPKKSEVKIIIEPEKKGVRVRIVDSGYGLDEKDIKNLFQKFYRSPHVMREVQGTGLGLYVVKQFTEAHGGHVWAKSDGYDKGSEFGLWLPIVPTGRMYTRWKHERDSAKNK